MFEIDFFVISIRTRCVYYQSKYFKYCFLTHCFMTFASSNIALQHIQSWREVCMKKIHLSNDYDSIYEILQVISMTHCQEVNGLQFEHLAFLDFSLKIQYMGIRNLDILFLDGFKQFCIKNIAAQYFVFVCFS